MLDVDTVRNWNFGEVHQTYTARDCMLYALGLGFGDNPTDPDEIRFVFERGLSAVPTMACVLAAPGAWLRDPRTGIDWKRAVHGEQRLEVLAPLPTDCTVVGHSRVASLADKGTGRGAVLVVERELCDRDTGVRLAKVTQSVFLRGDGGFSSGTEARDPAPQLPPALLEVPSRAPDFEVCLTTLRQAALIYRLSGDYNPIHADPDLARTVGFERPILHGLCSFGMAVRAALQAGTLASAGELRGLAARFTAPVYPGETLQFQFWREEGGRQRFRALIQERNAVAIDNGIIIIRT